MRRKQQELPEEKVEQLLKNSEYGVLSTIGEDGYPYGVAVNYIYSDGAIYFHCANEGHKLDNIAYNNKVSICVIGYNKVIEDKFDTQYESVVIFGRAAVVQGEEKKRRVIEIGDRFCPAFMERCRELADKNFERFTIIKIEIEHSTGKGNS